MYIRNNCECYLVVKPLSSRYLTDNRSNIAAILLSLDTWSFPACNIYVLQYYNCSFRALSWAVFMSSLLLSHRTRTSLSIHFVASRASIIRIKNLNPYHKNTGNAVTQTTATAQSYAKTRDVPITIICSRTDIEIHNYNTDRLGLLWYINRWISRDLNTNMSFAVKLDDIDLADSTTSVQQAIILPSTTIM